MINLFGFLKKEKSASIAKERLKLRIEHERSVNTQPDWFPKMQSEIIDVIRKYTDSNKDDFQVKINNEDDNISIIEINILIENN